MRVRFIRVPLVVRCLQFLRGIKRPTAARFSNSTFNAPHVLDDHKTFFKLGGFRSFSEFRPAHNEGPTGIEGFPPSTVLDITNLALFLLYGVGMIPQALKAAVFKMLSFRAHTFEPNTSETSKKAPLSLHSVTALATAHKPQLPTNALLSAVPFE